MCDAPIILGGGYCAKIYHGYHLSHLKRHRIRIYLILLAQILCMSVRHGGPNLHEFLNARLLCLFGWKSCKCSIFIM